MGAVVRRQLVPPGPTSAGGCYAFPPSFYQPIQAGIVNPTGKIVKIYFREAAVRAPSGAEEPSEEPAEDLRSAPEAASGEKKGLNRFYP
jgi:hypothetical protein